jgi:hypothetical protein
MSHLRRSALLRPTRRSRLVEDDLIAFPGDTMHAVNDLRACPRLSVGRTFYLAIGHGV